MNRNTVRFQLVVNPTYFARVKFDFKHVVLFWPLDVTLKKWRISRVCCCRFCDLFTLCHKDWSVLVSAFLFCFQVKILSSLWFLASTDMAKKEKNLEPMKRNKPTLFNWRNKTKLTISGSEATKSSRNEWHLFGKNAFFNNIQI